MAVHFHEEDLPQGVLAPGPVAVDTETMSDAALGLARGAFSAAQVKRQWVDAYRELAA